MANKSLTSLMLVKCWNAHGTRRISISSRQAGGRCLILKRIMAATQSRIGTRKRKDVDLFRCIQDYDRTQDVAK